MDDPTFPIPQSKDWFPTSEWLDFHRQFMAGKAAGPIELLFLGDSITMAWDRDGKEIWDREYAPRNAANFGIGGDETQHLLWRITHGELDDINPKLVVLLIGTNNLGNSGMSAGQTTAGVIKVIDTVVELLPTSKLLTLGIFPRIDVHAPPPTAIPQINAAIAARADQKQIWHLDIGPHFLEPDGSVDPSVMPDGLHLSEAAYQIWADAMRPTITQLM